MIESPFRCLSLHHSVGAVSHPFLDLDVSATFLALHDLSFSCHVFLGWRAAAPHERLGHTAFSSASILFQQGSNGQVRILFLFVHVHFCTAFCAVPLAPSCWPVSRIFSRKRTSLCIVPSQCLLVTKVSPVSESISNLSWRVRFPDPLPLSSVPAPLSTLLRSPGRLRKPRSGNTCYPVWNPQSFPFCSHFLFSFVWTVSTSKVHTRGLSGAAWGNPLAVLNHSEECGPSLISSVCCSHNFEIHAVRCLPTSCSPDASSALFLSTWSKAFFESICARNAGMSDSLASWAAWKMQSAPCSGRTPSGTSDLQSLHRAQPQVTHQLPQCRQTRYRSEPAQPTCSYLLGCASFFWFLCHSIFTVFSICPLFEAFETVSREMTTGSVGSRALNQAACQAVTLRWVLLMIYS